jgi:hypothetical protein
MFKNCYNLTTIPELDLNSISKSYGMFSGCSSLNIKLKFYYQNNFFILENLELNLLSEKKILELINLKEKFFFVLK